jgi:oxygen-dependent protoporphyrinogen oxidase
VHCGAAAVGLQRTFDGFRVDDAVGRSWQAASVVLATPAAAAAGLLAPLAQGAADALAAVEYAPIVVLVSCYARADVPHALDGFGFLAPAREPVAVLGTLFSSTMFAGRVPERSVLLTSFLGGRRHAAHAALPDEALLALVRTDLQRCLGVRAAPAWTAVTRWPRAIPQTTRGHGARMQAVAEAESALPGLYCVGNYRGGVSISDCIDSAQALARRILLTRPAVA